ncbi:Synembryn-A [Oryzias melastigma]|uniref:Synembryn n=1 Tax=Oryzias melastigma TaxID=30732 RepID=A0A834KXB9_ORYME|nr:Synembryn-A [Oryzias melastigma]
MDVDVEGIIQCIKQGDENGVQMQLQEFNKQYAQCFFFDAEERERRRNLGIVLVRFIRSEVKHRLLKAALRTLRILSRDKKTLSALVTDSALLTLGKLALLTTNDTSDEASDPDSDFYDNIIASLAEAKSLRKEAMKVLCNVVYNSTWAQERFSALKLMNGLIERISSSINWSSPSSVQFYELRLMFLITALRPELNTQLQQAGGVSILTAALESTLEVQWKEQYECALDPAAPPISPEASQRIIEILKILFNITYSNHRQEPGEDDAALYRHLVAIMRLCLMRKCMMTDDTDELQGHTVNLLTALPLQCLDVLLSVPLTPNSQQSLGVNMDCVHMLLLFMERRLESGDKVKEKLTPILNLLTESCRAHRETRLYIRKHILPPLRDVSHKPEEGNTVKSRLIRLMTHLDTDLKHCAADLIFVLCKENVRRFVKYTGYGNAAGLLATRGLLGGQGVRSYSSSAQYSSDSDSDTEEYRQVRDRINPVTGRMEVQQPDPMEGMTEEEKEEEAKRLITLFSKLSRDNIIQPMGAGRRGEACPFARTGRQSDD